MDNQPYENANGDNLTLVFIIDLNEFGFDQFVSNITWVSFLEFPMQVTKEETGFISSIQQLIRDITYYDGKFIGRISLITFGNGPG